MSPADKHESWADSLREVAPLVGLGMQFAVTIVLCVGIGYWVDSRYAFSPWGTLTGGVCGIAVGFYHFLRTVLSYNKKDGKKDDGRNR